MESASSGLRQRHTVPSSEPIPTETAPGEAGGGEMGKTADGTIFKIPQTHDMLSSLFDPRLPKSHIDILTLTLLSLQLVLFCTLSTSNARMFFLFYFACWRLAYNAGLGVVLKKQSEEKWIVKTVAKHGWMDGERRPKIKKWIKGELMAKMGKDYDFEAVPLEFNVWILFRHSVDVILLNDFLAYVCFALSYLQFPASYSVVLHVLRWIGGFTLIFFNLWVKVDAHRIVKDFAWYWGDAFFMSLQTLVFDGVFELAPHPMYSVGYAGYYGLSLIAASETVLFVSLVAHACQFGFLLYFENPHIERTYGERKPLAARTPLHHHSADDHLVSPPLSSGKSTPLLPPESTHLDRNTLSTSSSMGDIAYDERFTTRTRVMTRHDLDNRYFGKDLLIFRNFDIFRNRDLAFALVVFYGVYAFILPSFGKTTQVTLAFINALLWRVFHSFGLGLALKYQSEKKWIVRHFLKHYHFEKEGGAVEAAFKNWKATYNLSLCMSYASFGALAWVCYTIPMDWTVGTQLVRHTLGMLLVALHVWTAQSTFEVLGPFGWFYGDFFIEDYPNELYYTGIYRFLNNPERSMGGAAYFGLVLICGSKLLLIQAVIAVLAHWWFLSAVENPHMKKLYGESVRKYAGVTKTLRNVAARNAHVLGGVTRSVKEVSGSVEKVFEEAADAVEEFLQRSAPKLQNYVDETKILLKQSGERLVISRVANDISSYDTTQYSLSLLASTFHPSTPHASSSTALGRFHLGEPISVEWTAPTNHSSKDWIGIYRRGANKSQLVTKVSSQGKWIGVRPDEWEGDSYYGTSTGEKQDGGEGEKEGKDHGVVTFSGKKLPWTVGVYEIRYHHDGKHNVMARANEFEVYVEKPSDPDDLSCIHTTLTSIIAQTLSYNLSVIPASSHHLLPASLLSSAALATTPIIPTLSDPNDFIIFSVDEADHIAYAIEVAFEVELAHEVVVAAANVERLARTIGDARRSLKIVSGKDKMVGSRASGEVERVMT